MKLTENFHEVISNEGPYQKFTDLQTAALRVFKARKVASMVELLSSEAGANRFSTEQLLQKAAKTFQKGMHTMKRTSSWMFYSIINLERQKLKFVKAK